MNSPGWGRPEQPMGRQEPKKKQKKNKKTNKKKKKNARKKTGAGPLVWASGRKPWPPTSVRSGVEKKKVFKEP